MALESEVGIGLAHATTIVRNSDQGASRIDQFDFDSTCPGIDRILEQFFEGGSRALYNFPSRDLIDRMGVEEANLRARGFHHTHCRRMSGLMRTQGQNE